MPKALTPQLRNQHMAAVHALGHQSSPPPQTRWAQPAHGQPGQSAAPARIVASPAVYAPNTPNAASLAQGIGSNLTAIWAGPTIDSTHNAAAGYNLRSSPSGAGIYRWCQASPGHTHSSVWWARSLSMWKFKPPTPRQVGRLVGRHDRQNLGCHCRAERLDCGVLAGSQYKRCTERQRAEDCGRGADRRGIRCSLRAVGEQFHRSDYRTDRERRRAARPMAGRSISLLPATADSLPLDAGARDVGNHGVVDARSAVRAR